MINSNDNFLTINETILMFKDILIIEINVNKMKWNKVYSKVSQISVMVRVVNSHTYFTDK